MTKGLKTFNLRHSTIAIVKKKANQSEFVVLAVVQFDDGTVYKLALICFFLDDRDG